MAFSESLAARVRDALARKRGVEEKKMFGCILSKGQLSICRNFTSGFAAATSGSMSLNSKPITTTTLASFAAASMPDRTR